MEFATGAMSSLLPKLGELLLEEYHLKDSVKKGIGDLKAELESMQGALEKVSSVPLDKLDRQVKIWANEVRELSYAIEDSLDSFVTRVKGVEPTKPKIKHLFKMVRNEFTKFSARHKISDEIKDIESQVMKIKERYERYKINDIVPNPTSTAVDPRLSALYNKVSDLVGTDGPIDELKKILYEGVATSQKSLKIVSIVGIGGLGKTTLAKALYDKLSQTYQCQGFVPVGQNQEAKKVLRDIMFELDKELYKDAVTLNEIQMINQLRNFLAGKSPTSPAAQASPSTGFVPLPFSSSPGSRAPPLAVTIGLSLAGDPPLPTRIFSTTGPTRRRGVGGDSGRKKRTVVAIAVLSVAGGVAHSGINDLTIFHGCTR